MLRLGPHMMVHTKCYQILDGVISLSLKIIGNTRNLCFIEVKLCPSRKLTMAEIILCIVSSERIHKESVLKACPCGAGSACSAGNAKAARERNKRRNSSHVLNAVYMVDHRRRRHLQAKGTVSQKPCRLDHLLLWNTGYLFHPFRRKGHHIILIAFKSNRVLFDIFFIMKPFGYDDSRHTQGQSTVCSGNRLKMDIGMLGRWCVAAVDNDRLHSPFDKAKKTPGAHRAGIHLIDAPYMNGFNVWHIRHNISSRCAENTFIGHHPRIRT